MSKHELENQSLHRATEVLRAVAHPLRMRIIILLYQREQLAVKDIHESLGVAQPVASHHLRIMKTQGIVLARRDGQSTIYRLAEPHFYDILRHVGVIYNGVEQ